MITSILQAQGLECIRDDRLLFSDLSFVVEPGQVLQIEGANGCGKTSLLRILCGLRTPDTGSVLWNDKDILAVRETYYENLVYIGHLSCIKSDLTTEENIHSLLDTRSQKLSSDKIAGTLKKVGLKGFGDVPGKSLSSGQKRRVLLAFLQLAQARLWILDEPLTALDTQGVKLMEDMIIKYQENGGSVVFTTHHGMQLPCEMQSVTLSSQ